jgi:hypothetical protein
MLIRPPVTSLIIIVLVVWRVTHLLWGEDGPGDIFVRLRRLFGSSFAGRVLDCFYCLSLWVAAPFAWIAGTTWSERGLLWLSFSAGAILLERATARTPTAPLPPPAQWHEEPLQSNSKQGESKDVMLR